MNITEIKKLLELFSSSDAAKLSIKEGDFELKLERYYSAPVITESTPLTPITAPREVVQTEVKAEVPRSQAKNGDYITSPMVGTFYRSPSVGAAPYVNVGDVIKKGQVICIIEAMKIMNEIEAEYDCKILSIEVDDASPVEFNTPLIGIERL